MIDIFIELLIEIVKSPLIVLQAKLTFSFKQLTIVNQIWFLLNTLMQSSFNVDPYLVQILVVLLNLLHQILVTFEIGQNAIAICIIVHMVTITFRQFTVIRQKITIFRGQMLFNKWIPKITCLDRNKFVDITDFFFLHESIII